MPRADEIKVYGVNACQALFARRPADVLRVYLVEERVPEFGELLKACARLRRPYKIVAAAELNVVTESSHHEGVCVVARPPQPVRLEEVVRPPGPAIIVALPDVGNPHNVGALIRSAAHFGARAAMMPPGPGRLPPSAYRIAQGGAEHVALVYESDLDRALRVCRAAGFSTCASSSHGGRDLFAAPLPPRMVLFLGAEDVGLPPEILREADLTVRIPGSGHVESLNVAASAAVILAEHWRVHRG